jgi:ABC-type branched-subunit amino acid transport system substrate-binding protein
MKIIKNARTDKFVICIDDKYIDNKHITQKTKHLTKGKIYQVLNYDDNCVYTIQDDLKIRNIFEIKRFKIYNFRKEKLERILDVS